MTKQKKAAAPTPAPRAGRRIAGRLLLSVTALVAFFGLAELALRGTGFQREPRPRITYHPWIAMMFRTVEEHFPTVLDPPGHFWMMPQDLAGRDAQGAMHYRWPVPKRPGMTRVAFLGGSTTQPNGYRDYPRRVIKLLNDVAGTNRFEALNLGLSGYSTHQSLIALERIALPRQPDVVVVYHGWNDPTVNFDGRSDRMVDQAQRMQSRFAALRGWGTNLANWRVTRLLGVLSDAMDRDWPHARVTPDEFRENLLRMADLCRDRGIRFVVVRKPLSQTLPINEYEPILLQHWGSLIGSTNKAAVYAGLHALYRDEQLNLPTLRPHAVLADAESLFEARQRELAREPREGVALFQPDAVHLNALGNQALAEVVAPAAAPELAAHLATYTASAAYWRRLAEEFDEMDSPFECHYAAGRAATLNPEWAEAMRALQSRAEGQFAFWRLFDEYRWGNGTSHPLDLRLRQLATCLEMRPDDFGVAQQIHRCAMYLNDRPAALPLLRRFRPSNPQDRYRWLQLRLDAGVAAQAWQEVHQVAGEILKLNPQDAGARQVMQALQGAR